MPQSVGFDPMKLFIVHYHLRPGGVRRVIELALPHLVRSFGQALESITIASGEKPDAPWRLGLCSSLEPMLVEFFVDPALGYHSEQTAAVPRLVHRLERALQRLFASARDQPAVVWAHNLGLARNLLLTRQLMSACAARGIPLIAHHHDWWFDNRWQRWPEIQQTGCRTLNAVAATILSAAPVVRHVAINQADARILRRHFHAHAAWIPNLRGPRKRPARARIETARRWLEEQVGEPAPIWLMPCRLLRRKNIAEGLLLTRWLRPEAWLVSTGGVSSAEERAYASQLSAAARAHRWRLRLGLLQGQEGAKPTVPELAGASEAILLTSVVEGFGLPFLEAATAQRPLIARSLPNVAPDLARFGFRFSQCYPEILIPRSLFDVRAERRRQEELFAAWRAQLPRSIRSWAGTPILLASATLPVPFSRLTLGGQLEVLAQPADETWKRCAPLNPFLAQWRRRAQTGRLQRTPWPRTARQQLSGATYARRFQKILGAKTAARTEGNAAGAAAQADFMRERLASPNLFPLLWSNELPGA